MKKSIVAIGISTSFLIFLFLMRWNLAWAEDKMAHRARTLSGAIELVNWSADDLQKSTSIYADEIQNTIRKICSIKPDDRTYANTFGALDSLIAVSDPAIFQNICFLLGMVSPDENIRNAAHHAEQKIHEIIIDHIINNKLLYHACAGYVANTMPQEQLSAEQHYFITETMADFKRAGLQLPDEELEKVRALNKEIVALGLQFDQAIAENVPSIIATQEELSGVDPDFIKSLAKNEDGLLVLTMNYPIVKTILTTCTNGDLRKKVFHAFNNRAYPMNETTLKSLIAKRQELAHMLGYQDFAQLNLSDQMIKSPARARAFLYDLKERAQKKVADEFTKLHTIAHPSITINPDGKVAPWDLGFIEEIYKKEHFSIDDEVIAHYFPIESTIDGLLAIYRDFFDISFKEVYASGLWDDSVRIIQVFSKDNKDLLGTLFVDLYPRAGKYTHACQLDVVPAILYESGQRQPGLAAVLANFPAPSAERPALLKLRDVNTFFHEFGHALHALLGANNIASLSGTHTKIDFVELPSQLLEEWLWNKDILKKLSNHHVTHEPLSDETIANIVQLKQFDIGYETTRQIYLSLLALEYYSMQDNADLHAIMERLYTDIIKDVAFYPDSHFYTSFGHLYGYGARYYGYLWSRVFAADLFDVIKQYGLTNSVIGKKYAQTILMPGGTQDPNQLLQDFLGRAPSSEAFFKDMNV